MGCTSGKEAKEPKRPINITPFHESVGSVVQIFKEFDSNKDSSLNREDFHQLCISIESGIRRLNCVDQYSIDSLIAWEAKADAFQSFEIDAREATWVAGLVIQGDPKKKACVSHFQISHSEDGDNWFQMDEIFCGVIEKTKLLFREPVRARFIRILPLEWVNQIALRCDLLQVKKIENIYYEARSQVETLISEKTPLFEDLGAHMSQSVES